jgi:CxxC motif-containing protein
MNLHRRKQLDFLQCPQDEYEAINEALDKTRRTSTTVKVSRSALTKLLIDHAKLIDRVEKIA